MGNSFSTPPSMTDVLSKSDFPTGASFRLSDLGDMTPGVTNPCSLSDFAGKSRKFGDITPYGYVALSYKGFDMTGVEAIIEGTDIADDNLYLDLLSLRAVVTFDEDTEGIIFETGGSGVGCALYIDDKKLYWQAGAGGTVGGSIELLVDITGYSNGPREIVVTTDFQGSVIAGTLSVNGTQLDSVNTTGTATYVAGSDAGGSGAKYSGIAVLRNNQQSNFGGTIHSVRIYNI